MINVLWVENILFNHHRKMVGQEIKVTGATWLYAAYKAACDDKNIVLHIVTASNVETRLVEECDGNKFYILPGGGIRNYDYQSVKHKKDWEWLREQANPDIVVIWGTEQPFSFLAMQVMKGIPMVIYMQGVMRSIYEHYYEGVPNRYQTRTIRDYFDLINKGSQISSYKTQVDLEKEMLLMADGIVVENDWCEDMCKNINPSLTVFRNNLPISQEYYVDQWNVGKIKKHTIFTNSGGYPIKGHHILFKALSIVKEKYPDVQCFLPGYSLDTFLSFRRKTGYMSYLQDLITKYGLADNIIYTGHLSTQEMKEYILSCNVFVMPSIMENHSSSLIEAMLLGAPCVTSLVGGTASLVSHKNNGILYNSLDYMSLAGNIIRLFEDDKLAEHLGAEALKLRDYRKTDFGCEMNAIYDQLLYNK